MADGGSSSGNSWESWFGEWVQTAKEKSSTALEFVKKDLAEFTCTIQKETEKAMEKTSSSLTKANTEQATNKFKAGISTIFDNISKALVIPPDDDYVPMRVSADGTSLYDRGKARLHALQLDASTYIDQPRGPPEQYTMWLESFDMEQHKGEISEILVSKVEVRALYTKLVPNEVSHADFWQRYFYKVHQLQCDEARKRALMQRADQARGDSLSWDDDWSGGEEEDDGNQSDWEKMPRPSQSSLSEEHKSPPEPPLNTSSPPNDAEENRKIPVEQQSTGLQEHVETSPSPVETERPEPSLNQDQSNANVNLVSTNSTQSESATSSKDTINATNTANQDICGSIPSQPSPDLWSLHVPSDTASASHPETGDEGVQGDASMPTGSAPDVRFTESSRLEGDNSRQKEDAVSGAAAASMELPSQDDVVENLTADGACGAAYMVDAHRAQVSEKPPNNLDIPAASSSSVPESNVIHEETKSEVTEPSDAALPTSTSAPGKEASEETVEEEKGKQQLELTVQTDNPVTEGEVSPEIGMRIKGDMVVVGERGSPSTESSDTKDLALDEEWEQDFDVEVTEEDLKAAEDIAKKLGENLDAEDDDWENWE